MSGSVYSSGCRLILMLERLGGDLGDGVCTASGCERGRPPGYLGT
jgi:hypothetical protein